MVAFGIILLLLGVGGGAALAWLLLQNDTALTLSVPGFQIGLLPITIFAAGALSMLLLWLGARLLAAGARRRKERRAEMRDLRATADRRPEREPVRAERVREERAEQAPREKVIERDDRAATLDRSRDERGVDLDRSRDERR